MALIDEDSVKCQNFKRVNVKCQHLKNNQCQMYKFGYKSPIRIWEGLVFMNIS